MKKLYVIGDSISGHYWPFLKSGLCGMVECIERSGEIEARLNLDDPQGANSGDSKRVLALLRAHARTGGINADLLLVNCGLHDIKTDPRTGQKQVPLDQYVQNLKALVATARSMQPTLAWVRTTPCDDRVHNHPGMAFHRFARDADAYNRAAESVMTEAGVPILDLYTFTVNLGPDLYCDHVHFHEHIREKQGAFIAGWVMARFAGQSNPAV